MADLETISQQIERLETQAKDTDAKVDLIKRHLVGTLDERGLTRRVEDLEENERKRSRYVTAALVAAIAAVITWPIRTLWGSITGGGP